MQFSNLRFWGCLGLLIGINFASGVPHAHNEHNEYNEHHEQQNEQHIPVQYSPVSLGGVDHNNQHRAEITTLTVVTWNQHHTIKTLHIALLVMPLILMVLATLLGFGLGIHTANFLHVEYALQHYHTLTADGTYNQEGWGSSSVSASANSLV